jgi:hypothetical protein
MTPRERTLAILLVGAMVLVGGSLLGYVFLYTPLQEKWGEAAKLDTEIAELDAKAATAAKLRPRIAEIKRQSLPADLSRTTLQYQQLLEQLRPAGLRNPTDYQVKVGKTLSDTPPVTPALAPRKPAYKRLEFTVDIDHAHMWQVVDFLGRFYQLDLLHQITEFRVARANNPTEMRNDLDVSIRIEAIILDGAEPRSTLFPVTNAIAAVGGFPALAAVANRPDVARYLMPTVTTPVLAERGRDYSAIVKHDIFYGELPPPVTGPPFSLARIDDVVINKPDDPTPVKFALSGRGAESATVTATVKSGTLFNVGPLDVDMKTRTIKLPKVSAELGSEADALVTVVATSPDGVSETRRFEIKMGQPSTGPTKPLGPDIAGVIKLVAINGSFPEATLTALICDQANPFEYRVAFGAKGIHVSKWVQTPVPKSRPPRVEFTAAKAYAENYPANVLAFSDEWSGTKRTFRVIALESEALILAELGGPDADAKQDRGKGKGPGGPRPGQGKADPLAGVAGNPAVAAAPGKPGAYYRWPLGRSLKDIVNGDPNNPHRLPEAEVKKILQRVAESGPLASGN